MKNKKKMCKVSVHAGHRQRMVKKYEKLGADAFEAHELLEMLLFFCIGRKNTNEISHNLINKFGSISAAFSAKANALIETDGIGGKSALLLSLCRDTIRRCSLEHSSKTPLDNNFKRTRYIYNWYKGKPAGTVMAMFLDDRLMLCDTVTISAGRLFRPESYPDVILEKALALDARHVIISHSHKDNCPDPSPEDLYLAGQIRAALGAHGIELINQYIVTEFDCAPTNNFNI